ncbi:MAG TPA: hypothetical protein VFO83_13215, partial [Aggregicoccus sp.]|nr:hypothetical protein [Aggregicoccus sp.]
MSSSGAVASGRLGALLVLLLTAPAALAQGAQVPATSVPAPDVPLQAAPARLIPRLYPFYKVGAALRTNPIGLFTHLTFQLRYRLY